MTKAERIRGLTAKYPHLNSVQIAQRLGFNDSYVRTVWQRMRGKGSQSTADRNYVARHPEHVAKSNARSRRWYCSNREKKLQYMRAYRAEKREASHA